MVGGYSAGDLSVNASGRATGGTSPLGGGYPMDGSGLSVLSGSTVGFFSLEVDGSGNLWVSGKAMNSTFALQGSQLTEFIGLTAPAQKPLSSALTNSANNKGGLGARP
jgi:hypothetical protein